MQNQVNILPPAAEPGALATTEASALRNVVPQCRAAADVNCGGFVFVTSAPEGTDAGLQEQFVAASGSEVAGFVYRVQDAALPFNSGASLAYASGRTVPVANQGSFYCKIVNGGTVGQKVLADVTNGSANAGDSATSSLLDTGFTLKTAVSSGGIAIIGK